MLLYCVRHGEAYSADQDPHCRLTPEGQRRVAKMSHHLAQCRVQIPMLIHSGKPRAEQTASILAKAVQVSQVTVEPKLLDCEGDIMDLLVLLPAWAEDTMLVGHLPFMSKLINALVLKKPEHEPIIPYSPATIVCLERQYGSHWTIRWVLNPEIIPDHF